MPNLAPQEPPNIFLRRQPVQNRPDTIERHAVESHRIMVPHFDYTRAAQLFRTTMESNRQGTLRLAEAEFQNRIIRYLSYNASQLQTLLQKISRDVQNRARSAEEHAAIAKQFNGLQIGIIAVINVIKSIEAKFIIDQKFRRIPPGMNLF